jgi:hypothetical protein
MTAVTGVYVTVSLPIPGETVNTGGLGGLEVSGLVASYGESVPTVGMVVQMVNGAGRGCLCVAKRPLSEPGFRRYG